MIPIDYRALFLGSCFFFPGYSSATADSGDTKSVTGVLSLKNGHVIHGTFSLMGETYEVTSTDGQKVTVPRTDVSFVGANTRNVYEHKLHEIDMTNVSHHVELARWCLRTGLLEQARQHASLAATLAPNDQRINVLRHGIATTTAAVWQPEGDSDPYELKFASATLKEPMSQIRNLSQKSRQVFLRQVQPLLISRCSGCHSVTSTHEFVLRRTTSKGAPASNLTVANLNAVLRETATDRDRFTRRAGTSHAGSVPLTQQETLEIFEPWLRSLDASRRAPNNTIDPDNGNASSPEVATGTGSPTSVDPFDPARFNEQTLDQQQTTRGSLGAHATNGSQSPPAATDGAAKPGSGDLKQSERQPVENESTATPSG
ncbi:MAG: hypothetical protein O2931_05065 [Planctomycetota bacterium]|nr:hypothetical protein [Planctomycetota bacterium]MDA1178153.1 hypothetical protein [Planctomycetota bacterium]